MAPIVLSAPSSLIPDGLPANVRAIRKLACESCPVRDVGLSFFEAQACIDYTEEDLPPWLPETGLTFHMHLPLDPGWSFGAQHVGDVATCLADKVAFLSPWGFVLHPPPPGPGCVDALKIFAEVWRASGRSLRDVLLENIELNGLLDGLPSPQPDLLGPALDMGFGLCLDVGHVIAFGQQAVVERLETLAQQGGGRHIRLAHVYDPGHIYAPDAQNNHWHQAMDGLAPGGRGMTGRVLALLADDGRAMPEVFDLDDYLRSVPVLEQIVLAAGLELAAGLPTDSGESG